MFYNRSWAGVSIEEMTVEVDLNPNAFIVVTEEGKCVPGSSFWTFFASNGQPNERTQELTGKKIVKIHLN